MSDGSFKRIDYSLRPAKHAERRMLTDVFRRLRFFAPVEDYRYIGLGSLWFSDFALFHRSLGLKNMLSIEREAAHEARFQANKPFRVIELDFRSTSSVLPGLDWSQPAFVWLDYDDPITGGMLFDIDILARNVASGTVLAITVQCNRAGEVQESAMAGGDPSAMELFREHLGANSVPTGTSEDDLEGWPFADLSRTIVAGQIEAALATRNLGMGDREKVEFTPICDIEYMDGAKMTTIVGVFATVADQGKVERCDFPTLEFIPADRNPIRIEIPVLTFREIKELERQLPLGTEALNYGTIPTGHADKFAKYYRYLPNFAVLEQ